MQFWTGEIRFIRVVVRRFAPRKQRMLSAAPLIMRFPHNSPMVKLYGNPLPKKQIGRFLPSQPCHHLLHPLLADVGVNLGRGDALVAQQGLDVHH